MNLKNMKRILLEAIKREKKKAMTGRPTVKGHSKLMTELL